MVSHLSESVSAPPSRAHFFFLLNKNISVKLLSLENDFNSFNFKQWHLLYFDTVLPRGQLQCFLSIILLLLFNFSFAPKTKVHF